MDSTLELKPVHTSPQRNLSFLPPSATSLLKDEEKEVISDKKEQGVVESNQLSSSKLKRRPGSNLTKAEKTIDHVNGGEAEETPKQPIRMKLPLDNLDEAYDDLSDTS